jgi:hypothetical protein
MKQAKRIKRDMLIFKLATVDGDTYPDIAQRLVARGYEELHPEHIGRIVRKMRKQKEAKA